MLRKPTAETSEAVRFAKTVSWRGNMTATVAAVGNYKHVVYADGLFRNPGAECKSRLLSFHGRERRPQDGP